MIRNIEQKIVQINKATGIEIIFMPDDTLLINSLTAVNRKGSVIKDESVTNIREIKILAEKVNKSIPLAVVLNGKGILTRKTTATHPSGNPIASLLPGANPAEFYYQIFETPHFSQISIVRKDLADKIVHQLKELGFTILSVSPGFSSLTYITPFLKPDESKEVAGSSFVIHFNGGSEILELRSKDTITVDSFPQEYLVANQYVKSTELLSFAASLHLMAEDLQVLPAVASDMVVKQREDFRYYKLFRSAGLTLLSLVFVILLSSFLIYSHYFSLNKQMAFDFPVGAQQSLQLRNLEKEIKQKERFLDQSGWTFNGKISYYADRIASLTPPDILLTTMNIYPGKTNLSGDNNSFSYKKDTILVAGISPDPVLLNQFISGVKIITDFREVVVKNYQYRKEKEAGTFLIEIITK